MVAWGWEGASELTTKGPIGAFRHDGKVPYLEYGGSYESVYICQNSLNCTF